MSNPDPIPIYALATRDGGATWDIFQRSCKEYFHIANVGCTPELIEDMREGLNRHCQFADEFILGTDDNGFTWTIFRETNDQVVCVAILMCSQDHAEAITESLNRLYTDRKRAAAHRPWPHLQNPAPRQSQRRQSSTGQFAGPRTGTHH